LSKRVRTATASWLVGAGLLVGVVACGGDESEPQRGISVCVPVTPDRAAGVPGRIEIREAATVLSSASIAAGGSFEAQIPTGAAVDVYLDGVLLGSSPEGARSVSLGCPPA